MGDKNISAANFDFKMGLSDVPFVGVQLVHGTGDLCKETKLDLNFWHGGPSIVKIGYVDIAGYKCPLQAGPVELDFEVHISDVIVPQLAYTNIALTAVDPTSGDKILCATLSTVPHKNMALV